jgi:hypothetical protein
MRRAGSTGRARRPTISQHAAAGRRLADAHRRVRSGRPRAPRGRRSPWHSRPRACRRQRRPQRFSRICRGRGEPASACGRTGGIAVGRVAIGPADREPIWAVAVTTCTREKTTLTGMDAVRPVQDRPVHRSATPKALAARLADAQDPVLVVPRATTRAATRAVTSPTRPGTRPSSGGADARLRGLLGGWRSQPPSTPC